MELIQIISLKSLNLSGYRHLDYKILKSYYFITIQRRKNHKNKESIKCNMK